MQQIALAMKKSLVALERVVECTNEPERLRHYAPELYALSDEAIAAIMGCADRLIEKIVEEKSRG